MPAGLNHSYQYGLAISGREGQTAHKSSRRKGQQNERASEPTSASPGLRLHTWSVFSEVNTFTAVRYSTQSLTFLSERSKKILHHHHSLSQSASFTASPPPSYFSPRLHFLQQFPAFPHYLILRPYLFAPLCCYFHPTLSIYFWGVGGWGGSSQPPANRLINSHLCLSPAIHQKG